MTKSYMQHTYEVGPVWERLPDGKRLAVVKQKVAVNIALTLKPNEDGSPHEIARERKIGEREVIAIYRIVEKDTPGAMEVFMPEGDTVFVVKESGT